MSDDFIALDDQPDETYPGEAEKIDRPFHVDGANHRLRKRLGVWRFTLALKPGLSETENDQSEQHAKARCAETGPPAIGRAEIAASQRRPERTKVDAVIVKRETGIATWI